jgi:hypothetical protein
MAVCKPFAMIVSLFAMIVSLIVGLSALGFAMIVSPNRRLFASRGD